MESPVAQQDLASNDVIKPGRTPSPPGPYPPSRPPRILFQRLGQLLIRRGRRKLITQTKRATHLSPFCMFSHHHHPRILSLDNSSAEGT